MKHRLLSTEQGLILVDEDAEIKANDFVYFYNGVRNEHCFYEIEKPDTHHDYRKVKGADILVNKNGIPKIIAGLPELPQITNSIEEIRGMIKDKDIQRKAELNYITFSDYILDKEQHQLGYIHGCKENKAEFTKEQFKKGMLEIYDRCLRLGANDINYVKIIDNYIDSLQPKIDCYVEVEEVTVGELCNKHKHVPEGNFGFASDVELVKKYKIIKIL